MKIIIKYVIVSFLLILKIIEINSTNHTLKRSKRYLDFLDKSRMTFRVNGRNILLRATNLFAYAYGIRCNLPIETDHLHLLDFNPHPHKPKIKKIKRRDVYETIEDMLNQHGLDGKACILKSYCEATRSEREGHRTGMLFKIFQLIFTLQNHDKGHFSFLKEEFCEQLLHQHCPFGFDSISPFTDD